MVRVYLLCLQGFHVGCLLCQLSMRYLCVRLCTNPFHRLLVAIAEAVAALFVEASKWGDGSSCYSLNVCPVNVLLLVNGFH